MLCYEEFCPHGMKPHWHGSQIYNESLAPPVQSWRKDYPQDVCPQLREEFKRGGSSDISHRCLKVYKRPWQNWFRKKFVWKCWRCGEEWPATRI